MTPHPLIFAPQPKTKVWGGRMIETLLKKPLPPDGAYGESWEIADLPGGESVVARGPMAGATLSQLVRDWGAELLGRSRLTHGRFPLVIKYLDAREPLSIQVHPGEGALDAQGRAVPHKHEAWHVLHADPGAVIYRGFKRGVTREQAAAAAGTRAIVDLCNALPVRVGQTVYCPAGTVHALGGGLLVAEVQTTCDITYRLYDWDRARPAADAGLHITQALDAIAWSQQPEPPQVRSHVAGMFSTVTRLVSCGGFQVEKVRFMEGLEQAIPYAEMVIWIVLEGHGEIVQPAGRGSAESLLTVFGMGDVVLLPAGMRDAQVRTHADCAWLEVTIPTPSDLAEHGRPSARELSDNDGHSATSLVQIGMHGR